MLTAGFQDDNANGAPGGDSHTPMFRIELLDCGLRKIILLKEL